MEIRKPITSQTYLSLLPVESVFEGNGARIPLIFETIHFAICVNRLPNPSV